MKKTMVRIIRITLSKFIGQENIKSLLINKRDIYIVNRIHGAIFSDNKSTKENPYTHFIVPDGLFFFYLNMNQLIQSFYLPQMQ